MSETPRTEAGRALLEDYHYPLAIEEVIDHILAIEAEAAALAHDRPSGSRCEICGAEHYGVGLDGHRPSGSGLPVHAPTCMGFDGTDGPCAVTGWAAARAALSGSSDPEPLREALAYAIARVDIAALVTRYGVDSPSLPFAIASEVKLDDVALSGSSDPEAVGLDVERLAKVLNESGIFTRDFTLAPLPADEGVDVPRSWARFLAQEYQALTEAKPESPA